MKILAAALTVLLALTCLCAQAETYYVSSKGNDANSGLTQTSAWASIAKVNDTPLAAGDTVLFEGEVIFSGSLGFGAEVKGTPALPIVLSSYGIGRAVIRSGTESGLWLYNTSGFKIENLVFEGAGRTVSKSAGMDIFIDLPATKLPYIYISHVEVYGYRDAGISIGSWGGTQGFRDVVITHTSTHDNGDAGILTWAEGNYTAHQNVYVAYTKAYNNAGIATKTTSHSGSGIILGAVDGGTIEYCEAYNNGWLNAWANGGPVGIWCYASNNVVIQYNESHHNKTGTSKDGGGFDIDGGSTNCILQYNYSHDNEGAGYLLAQYSGAKEMKNLTIRYNISENDGRKNGYGAIHLWSSGSKGGIQNAQIYNNTIYLSPAASGAPKAVWVQSGGATAASFRNNLFVTTGGVRLMQVDVTTGIRFEGNNYWASGAVPQLVWGGTLYNTLDSWRAATTQEYRNGVALGYFLDPKLKSPGKSVTISDPKLLYTLDGYKLDRSSALIGKALNLAAAFGLNPGTRDFWGNSITLRTDLCIGAHQVTENSKACLYGGAQPLTFGLAEGGAYSGPGVAAGFFTPEAAGVGNHALAYTYTDALGQQQALHHTVMVIDTKETEWTGGSGTTDWYDSQNWTTCVPTSSINASIPPTTAALSHYPGIPSGGYAAVNNLHAAGPLTIGQDATLEVHGTLTGANLITQPNSNIIFNSDTQQYIPGGTYENLVIKGPGTKIMAGAVRVSRTLDLAQSSLSVGAHSLALVSGASIVNYSAGRYIITDSTGMLTQLGLGPGTTAVYPIGTMQGYAPVTLHNNGTTDNFSIRVEEKPQTQKSISVPEGTINKTWHIEEEVTGGSDVAMTLQWSSLDEPEDFDRTESFASHYEGEAWQVVESSAGTVTQGATPDMHVISLSGVNSFSPFTVASSTSAPAPLPVSLSKFTAARQEAAVLLQWETASEQHNRGFDVEVSEDGRQFRKLAFIRSHSPNAQTKQLYTYRDTEAGKAGTRYYRLRQLDLDGTATYSPVRAVSFEAPTLALSVFPNPFSDKVTLEIETPTDEHLHIIVTDTKGEKVYQQSLAIRQGQTRLPLHLTKAKEAAIYILTAYVGNAPYYFKLVKK